MHKMSYNIDNIKVRANNDSPNDSNYHISGELNSNGITPAKNTYPFYNPTVLSAHEYPRTHDAYERTQDLIFNIASNTENHKTILNEVDNTAIDFVDYEARDILHIKYEFNASISLFSKIAIKDTDFPPPNKLLDFTPNVTDISNLFKLKEINISRGPSLSVFSVSIKFLALDATKKYINLPSNSCRFQDVPDESGAIIKALIFYPKESINGQKEFSITLTGLNLAVTEVSSKGIPLLVVDGDPSQNAIFPNPKILPYFKKKGLIWIKT